MTDLADIAYNFRVAGCEARARDAQDGRDDVLPVRASA